MNFTVLIESSKTFPEQDWEAVLWHNGNEDREWRALPLEELPSGRVIGPVSRLAFSYDFETQSTFSLLSARKIVQTFTAGTLQMDCRDRRYRTVSNLL